MNQIRKAIQDEILSIRPLDQLERVTKDAVIEWIESGTELCRLKKPNFPERHLVSYFAVVDGDYLLLVDHINAELWVPPGGHVEPGEHPRETVLRECQEELGFRGEFLVNGPILLTSTETLGETSGHTDISIWYALKGDKKAAIKFDRSEFHRVRWFHKDQLPKRTDPHLNRFFQKFYSADGQARMKLLS